MRPDEIATLLRRAIRERLLLPGQSLNQDELAKRFGVSRIPLREALRTLVGEGLVMMRPGIGAVVTELDPAELDELLSLREQLEPPLVAAVVSRVGPPQLAQLRQTLDRMSDLAVSDHDAWSTQHYAFHRRLLEHAGKPHSARLVVQVLNLLEPYMRLQLAQSGLEPHHKEHLGVLDAIEAGDAEKASELTSAAIITLRQDLAAFLAPAPEPDPLAALRDGEPIGADRGRTDRAASAAER